MKIFLTGASGFIGTHFSQALLNRGHKVLALSRIRRPARPGLIWYHGNLADPDSYREALTRFNPDAIAHLAWDGLPDYSAEMCEKNLKQSINLFELGADIECRTLFGVGSCWEYAQAGGPLSETAATDETKPFAQAKHKVRAFGEQLAKEQNILFIWPRLFFIYGPGQRKGSLIPTVMESLESRSQVDLKMPNAVQDFLFVTDVAEGLCALLELAPPEVSLYNVGSGVPMRVGDVAAIVADEMGITNFSLPMNDETSTDNGLWADMTRMTATTGWQPRYNIREGVRLTIMAKRDEQRDVLK